MNTLLLDTANWDLCIDADGNIAMASDPYSVAQDVASALRTFLGEVWFDTTQGVPYFQGILGKLPPIAFIKSRFIKAALTVPTVVQDACYLNAIGVSRELTGQVQFTTSGGLTGVVGVGGTQAQPFILGGSLLGGGGAI